MSYSEVKRLPIRYRHWFLDRVARHFKEKNEAIEKRYNKDASHSNDNLNNLAMFEQQINDKLKK